MWTNLYLLKKSFAIFLVFFKMIKLLVILFIVKLYAEIIFSNQFLLLMFLLLIISIASFSLRCCDLFCLVCVVDRTSEFLSHEDRASLAFDVLIKVGVTQQYFSVTFVKIPKYSDVIICPSVKLTISPFSRKFHFTLPHLLFFLNLIHIW